ncbi:hypothetical protein [uncultured Zhongshania sp.]|uniref:hypothetical protein n=1 Tax=uncultured Zhongshania sp. TaxID=1642288 RepID=UPI0030D729BF
MRVLLMALLASWFGVSAQAENQNVLTVKDMVELTRYEQVGAGRDTVLRGMSITKRIPRGWVDDFSERYLRTIVDDDGVTRHQVLLEMQYVGGWRYYRAATLADGQQLRFKAEERKFSRCSSAFLKCDQREIVTADLSREQLKEAMNKGLVVYFEAKKPGRDTVARFPAAYVLAYLIKLDGDDSVLPAGDGVETSNIVAVNASR